MLSLPPSVRIFVGRDPCDMRKSFDGLSALALSVLQESPQSGHLFVFFNRTRSMVKVLWWDRTGYLVLAKRLERGRFHFLDRVDPAASRFELSSSELMLILEGIDLSQARRRIPEIIRKAV
jgi:transposase